MTKCNVCQSINHWADQCPDREKDDVSYLVHELVLHSEDNALQSLLSETWNSAVLDTGATNNVCGDKWFIELKNSLNESQLSRIEYLQSHKPFRFGDGNVVFSNKAVKIPVTIGKTNLMIQTNVVKSNLPLLLSSAAMKKGKMTLNFDSVHNL